MSRFVRASKYRHVFGQTGKKEYNIENVKVSSSAWDTNLIACSADYISLNWNASGGGAFAILPLPSPFRPLPHSLPYKLPDVIPLARGHTAPVLDTAWNPFDDSLCASGGEDGKILLWKLTPDQFDNWGGEKWVPVDHGPVGGINASPRKVGMLEFHPTARHVVVSATGEHNVKFWDLNNTDDPRITLVGHTDTIQSMAFNPAGTLLVTTCRDRKLRLFDVRASSEPVRVTEGHGGIKGARVVWMGERDSIATTGFSKMSDRQVGIWETGGLGNVKMMSLDQSAGVVMPFWSDNSILFLAGKGDGNIRYYEYDADTLFPLSEHKSSDPQRGMCFLPRRALSVSDCEIARAYKVAGSGIEAIGMIVPRKADSFQSDIYPLAPSKEPVLEGGEFFKGAPVNGPKLVSLENGAISMSTASAIAPTRTMTAPSPAPAAAPTPDASPAIQKRMDSLSPTYEPSPAPTPATTSISIQPSPAPQPAPALSPAQPATNSVELGQLQAENDRLNEELREARAQIRNLELQVEGMRANAQRAAKALLDGN